MVDADVEPLLQVFGDPVAMRYYPEPFSQEKVEQWVRWSLDNCRAKGFGLWTVLWRETGEVIGDTGLIVQQVLGREELEIGYHIVPDYQGRGVATEAALACLDWAFANTDFDRIISMMVITHMASRRVAEKVHTKYPGEFDRKGLPHCFYGTTQVEYEARQTGK